MKKNVGKLDAIIRLVVALVLAILFITGKLALGSTLGIILLVVAVIFIATGFLNFCPLYKLIGVSTCKVN